MAKSATQKQREKKFKAFAGSEIKITALSDEPFRAEDSAAEFFDYQAQLGGVYHIIRNIKTQTPLTIGLKGTWGTGKTSAMR